MANAVHTLKDPFAGHQDLKEFKTQAEAGVPKAKSFLSDITTKVQSVATGYTEALADSQSNWVSDDNISVGPLTNITTATSTVLLMSITTDLDNIIGDVDKVAKDIKQIEDDYATAQNLRPGCYVLNGQEVTSSTAGATWDDRDNNKIKNANSDLADKVKKAEQAVQSIVTAANAVDLSINDSTMESGDFSGYKAYENDTVQREGKKNIITSVLSYLFGMAEGMLNNGEGALEGIVLGVTSILGNLGIQIPAGITTFIEGLADSGFVEGLADNLFDMFGGDESMREYGRHAGALGEIIGCAFIPGGSLIYGLVQFGKSVKKAHDEGKDLSDWSNLLWPIIDGVSSGFLEGSLIGKAILALTKTGIVSDVSSMIFGGNPITGILSGGWDKVKDTVSGWWDSLMGLFQN